MKFPVDDNDMQKMIRELWKKIWNKEFISYAFWGLTTTVLNIVLYSLLCYIMEYWIANIIAIVACKIYSYFTNKFFVFKSHCNNLLALIKELMMYILTTGFSGLVDFCGVLFLVEILMIDQQNAKYIITVIVILVNYVLRKKLVFGNANRESVKR